MENGALSLLLNGLKALLYLLALVVLGQQIFFALVLFYLYAKRVITNGRVGYIFGRSVYWLLVSHKGYTLRVKKLLLLSLFSKVELRDVNINCSVNVKTPEFVPEANSNDEPIDFRIPVRGNRWKLFLKFLPSEVRLVNVTIILPKQTISADLVVLRLEYNHAKNELSFIAFFHYVKEDQVLSLSQLEFSSQFKCHFEKNNGVNISEWSCGLNVAGLMYGATEPTSCSTGTFKHDRFFYRDVSISRYENIIDRLEMLSVHFENTNIILPTKQSFVISNASLRMTRSQDFYKALQSKRDHSATIALNSVSYSFSPSQCLEVPVINILLNFNLSTWASKRCLGQDCSCSCTVNVIDPTLSLSVEELEKCNPCFSPTEKLDTDPPGLLEKCYIPPFLAKIIISNCVLSLRDQQSNHYRLESNIVGVNFSFQSPLYMHKATVPHILSSLSDNSLRIEGFKLTYLVDHSIRRTDHTLCRFHKWDFNICQSEHSAFKIMSVLRSISLEVDELQVLVSLKTLAFLLLSKRSAARVGCSTELAADTFSYEFTLHIKGFTFGMSANDYFPKELPTIPSSLDPLKSAKYQMKLESKDIICDSTLDGFSLEFINSKLSKSSTSNLHSTSNDIVLMNSLKLRREHSITKVDVLQLKLEFDVNLIWFFFYFKNAVCCLLLDSYNETNKGSSLESSPCMEVNIKNCLVILNLPGGTTMLLLATGVGYKTQISFLCMEGLDVKVNSVYTKNRPVFVSLLNMNTITCLSDTENGIEVKADSTVLKMEYHFRFYTIVDEISNTIKAMKQLRSAFRNLSSFSILYPKADPPIVVKNIQIKTNRLDILVNEDIFEQELGLIYKIGILEQRERMEKLTLLQNSDGLKGPQSIIDAKYETLFENFSKSWIARYRIAKRTFHGPRSFVINNQFMGYVFNTFSMENDVNSLRISLDNMQLAIGPPSFPLEQSSSFIHTHGNGVPLSTTYNTNIPFGLRLVTSTVSVLLRDYPLPALFFPNTNVTGDMIFAEAMGSSLSWRPVFIPFASVLHKSDTHYDSIFGSHIIRTLTPIKTYMNLCCTIDSEMPTQISWGKSLQPGFQSVMLWFDFLTKPPLDPSPKIGFWDKCRLLLHGTFEFHWMNRSPVHLNIKGSSDPYSISDIGAGLTFAWAGESKLVVNGSNQPESFLKFTSEKFQMGVRDFQTRSTFDKIIMNLSGRVEWRMGMLFQAGDIRKIGLEPRRQPRVSHYEVELVHPDNIEDINAHDSYRGFRTDFIHLSFGVYSDAVDHGRNTVHLAPDTLSHFLAWWRLFSTYTSGPIRQGSLFPDLLQNGKKFGKSLFTVKYQLSLAPLEITHVHRHADSQLDLKQNNNIAFTGLKARYGSLKLDLHQKRNKVVSQNEILQISRAIWSFSMNLAELDFIDADIRIIFAVFDQEAVEGLLAKTLGLSADIQEERKPHSDDRPDFPLSSWFNKEDFVDLHQIRLLSQIPIKFSVTPFVYSPRITYFRNLTDQGLDLDYPFGDENIHECYLGQTHPEVTQRKVAEAREQQLKEEIALSQARIDSINEKLTTQLTPSDQLLKKLCDVEASLHRLKHSLHLIHQMLKDLEICENANMQDINTDVESSVAESEYIRNSLSKDGIDLFRVNTIDSMIKIKELGDVKANSSFDNRFIFHNVLVKIDRTIRDHLVNYAGSIAIRRQYQFFSSHKAMILLEELLKNRFQKTFMMEPELTQSSDNSSRSNEEILQIFEDFIRDVSDGFSPFDNYSIRFISPQLQITSDIEPSSAILIVSRQIELSIIDVHLTQENKGESLAMNTLIETRYCFMFSDSQFFILEKGETEEKYSILLHSNKYGSNELTDTWSPWLPLEASYSNDFLTENIFLKRNDMFIIFIRPNSLFFDKNNKSLHPNESQFHVGFPKLYLTSNSAQYSSIFNIVEDLMSFISDKDKKIDKLTQVFIADEIKFNLSKLNASVVDSLQKKIRSLKYLDSYTRLHDPQSYSKFSQDILVELQTTKLQLNLLMSAIKRNYDKLHLQSNTKKNNRFLWRISADELMWELYDENKNSFVVFGLGPSHFVRSETYYGSTSNKVSISTLQCYNLQDKCVYKELLGPYESHAKYDKNNAFIEVSWNMGVPIGGISNLLELNFYSQPIIFKMDYRTSEKLLSYLFPTKTIGLGGKQSLEVSRTPSLHETESPIVSPRPSFISVSSGNSASSPVTRRMMLLDWDLQSFTKVWDKNNFKNEAKHLYNPEFEMEEMVNRASKYFNVGKITVHSLVMSVSYKGSRSVITNVDDLIVKVPTIQYTNKVWSSTDFISSFKKDIVRVVLQHTGHIIGNKFVPHRNQNKYEPLKQISTLLKPDLQRLQKSSGSLPLLARLSSKNNGRLPSGSDAGSDDRLSNADEDIRETPERYDVEDFFPKEHVEPEASR